MRSNTLFFAAFSLISTSIHCAHASELDQFLVQKKIIQQDYKIANKTALNEILKSISVEDSRVMPYQLDQNTLLEKIELYADHLNLQGRITTPDFAQFIQNIGEKKFKSSIQHNLIQNCDQLFEHHFQRSNPYTVNITLTSTLKNYSFKIKNSECKF
ncbi:hypothetical protein G9F32_04890 [Acinetobacter sp. 194]|uniref:hypothetical protein n=1 Tax=Acinetobacter shaoyimingii TaxID=2715164 RepID=UPI001409C0FE|nr:hypothetical protein [Acinetobacter shaoyimingii]NHB57372.1 hypothetical protein [Acinetobacter shaoyimingii]